MVGFPGKAAPHILVTHTISAREILRPGREETVAMMISMVGEVVSK